MESWKNLSQTYPDQQLADVQEHQNKLCRCLNSNGIVIALVPIDPVAVQFESGNTEPFSFGSLADFANPFWLLH